MKRILLIILPILVIIVACAGIYYFLQADSWFLNQRTPEGLRQDILKSLTRAQINSEIDISAPAIRTITIQSNNDSNNSLATTASTNESPSNVSASQEGSTSQNNQGGSGTSTNSGGTGGVASQSPSGTTTSQGGPDDLSQSVRVDVLQEGSGPEAQLGDLVVVDYVGLLSSGAQFDSSLDREIPAEFTLGDSLAIEGWSLGLTGMKVGEKIRLTVPPELIYGGEGVGYGGKFGCNDDVDEPDCDPNNETYIINPNETLVFIVQLLRIN